MRWPILIIILYVAYNISKDHFPILEYGEPIITLAFYALIGITVSRWFIELGIRGKIKALKENPEKFKETQIDPDVPNKKEIFDEFKKFDEILKVNVFPGIKKNFFSIRTPEERKSSEWEVLIKTVEGMEIWYKIESKNGKITKLEKNVRGIE